MRGLLQNEAALAADAYLAWWSLAGVDCAIGEEPVDWLRPARPAEPSITRPLAAPAPTQHPATLDAFHLWLAKDNRHPESHWAPGRAILPTGIAGARLMIITDMPDPADMNAGALFADRAGTLFDAMLRAIGLTRDDIYLTAMALARPPGGSLDADDTARLVERMRAQVALVRPARLLLLGDRTIRALLPTSDSDPRDGLRFFNHEGGTVPVAATFHPRLLLTQPAAKAECWRTLQSLIEDKAQ
ncbi:uracil-DNA glycosylase family protein [Sphingobium aromaticiconvertens]|uniref:uracil-DNA glycosylase family protein n=1 Tax=Sphingobium aromaticiconvertens TaxID=365341 RepID=UPI0030179F65